MWDRLDAGQLVFQADPVAARDLFRRCVTMIEIEIFSYCNRRCWFCPNSQIDRMSGNSFMSGLMYSSIISQLSEINYDGMITYSRYNEPLSDRIILERLLEARINLPRARLHTNTNGDYLDHDYLLELYGAGIQSINVQLYLKNDERYDHEAIRRRASQTLERLGLPAVLTRDEEGVWLEYSLTYKDMQIRVYGRNFAVNGTNRAGQIDILSDYVRTAPCLMPFWSVYVDHNGKMVPCCNFRSDVPAHHDYITGDLSVLPDIFLNYANDRASTFRLSLLNDKEKEGLCRNCCFAVPDVDEGRIAHMHRLRFAAGERKA
ncbi:SPASM domain-containing protein [Azospirillum sp. YIM DDC1]|uniref:SPASM domain-containing protein n=1 Tax=Azospirillum aestuarii TaxID=2802052 RepID=A0ABS1I971_9PROT|nr:radical SAM/SPASM domain-containing protein [Azospirillum aestuarii]MBK4723540.1 SPASM domain-containing protein [Azospirillum aestuarii]